MPDIDRLTALAAESFARITSRRGFMRKALHVGFVTLAGTMAGQLISPSRAYAACNTINCAPPRGYCCTDLGFPCPLSGGCPTGCSICTTGQGSGCVYDTGWWTLTCANGNTILCYDCKCPSTGGYNDTCGCASDCGLP